MESKGDDSNYAASSVGDLLRWRAGKTPSKPAFLVPDRASGANTWQTVTYKEFLTQVENVAAGLLSLGLSVEDRVGIASQTRYEWVLADFAIQSAAGATTTVYPNTHDAEVHYILSNSQAKFYFVENYSQVEKICGFADLKNQLQKIILFEDDRPADKKDADELISFNQLQELGKEYLTKNPDCVLDATNQTGPETLTTLIYTSGTTGTPKGVELPSRCWVAIADGLAQMNILGPEDLQYLWLPLSHVFGKALLATQIRIGFCSAVDGRIDRIVAGLGETRPTIMCGAPRIYEKVRAAVLTKYPSKGILNWISRWAFSVGRDSRPYRLAGKPMPKLLDIKYRIADKLVFSKLKALMGGRIKAFISGSAKLSPQVQEWFYSAGIIVTEGYGLTETTAVAFYNHWKEPKFGTVGKITPGNEVKIAPDGEVLVRGPIVARGYHNMPELTEQAFDAEGWFRTGDVGFLDDEGFLTVTDRKKDLMKTSGGKYVAPQKVESVIVANIPYVSQAVAVGDGRKFISALITLDRDALLKWGKNHGYPEATYAELVEFPEIRASIEKMMERANSKLERWETVKKFEILPEEIDVDSGGVTASMKVKRRVIEKQYQDLIESMYPTTDGSVVEDV